ncbi:aspartyl-phosphate phosphatase Spo0E family protein [Petroclostridium sp. X23]|uniref:aspartyl-phosphate phosphatase Spo0E family protein n=1 Tax=Petroclostridium sp. X23 TaxID=3045146 RepID=UPI0024ADB25B|nr:aspartyl-phosphate phosphatase Spo0E family protein [Petroclostridium sp. X23]WHH60666.1 aspartyl-phosphate phosphatase Spo0E family protein [Petroclostridium sp. X23]
MKNSVKKPIKSAEELSDLVYRSESNHRSSSSSTGSGQCIDSNELEIKKESINQLRQQLHLLMIQPECNLVSEEVLSISRALDELVCDYQKAFGYFKEWKQQQKRMLNQSQNRRCCYGRE